MILDLKKTKIRKFCQFTFKLELRIFIGTQEPEIENKYPNIYLSYPYYRHLRS